MTAPIVGPLDDEAVIYHHVKALRNWYAIAWCHYSIDDPLRRGELGEVARSLEHAVEGLEPGSEFFMWLIACCPSIYSIESN